MNKRINKPNESQERRILKRLEESRDGWVHGDIFGKEMGIRQYHRAIFNLQHNRDKYKYNGFIKPNDGDEYGVYSYMITNIVNTIPLAFKKVETFEERTRRLLEC
jgi:hypothetical protein